MKGTAKFKRVAAAFDQAARVRSCDSNGSEQSADLSDLVNTFLERESRERKDEELVDQDKDGDDFHDDDERESKSPDFVSPEVLKSFFDHENDAVKRNIYAEIEVACREIGGCTISSTDFKRQMMARLRRRGFDAGICKSKWEKDGRCPFGNYEYVDVVSHGTRYIVEVSLAGEFTIARPTVGYASLLQAFPKIYVGRPEEMKQVVRLMCKAIRNSMKSVGIHLPPWRRLAYMHSKWFGSYKRNPKRERSEYWMPSCRGIKGWGLLPVQGISFYCREDFAVKDSVGPGNLTAILERKEMML